MKLDSEQRSFLKALTSGDRPPPANRRQDRVRQKLQRLGLAKFDHCAWRWLITDAGRRALSEQGEVK